MPFGLKNAQATFQRNMDMLIEECKKRGAKGVDAYVDNCIVMSQTFEDHIHDLTIMMEVLEEAQMSLRKSKCEFAFSKMEFLGFVVDGSTIKPAPSNINKIIEFPVPDSRKKVQSFLGIANYNRRFIPRYSELFAPLNRLISSKVEFNWTEVEQLAFESIRKAFHYSLSNSLPDWSKKFFVIRTDASKLSVGSVIGRFTDDGRWFLQTNWLPIRNAV